MGNMQPPAGWVPRNIVAVIKKMLAEIPETESALIAELQHVQHGAAYTAPEAQSLDWAKVTRVLNTRIQDVRPGNWQADIISIWLNHPIFWKCERGCGYAGNSTERNACEVCKRGRGD